MAYCAGLGTLSGCREIAPAMAAWNYPTARGKDTVRICQAMLVVVDISGYTRFITGRTLALQHAEQIINDLLGIVVDQSRHPLTLNKLEGDAALMYAEVEATDPRGDSEVLGQVRSFFPAFRQRVLELSAMRSNCSCDACANITSLGLKAFVNRGEILLKTFRQFDELAGEPVILLHRLMKNSVQVSEYVLMTDAVVHHAQLDSGRFQSHLEEIEGMGSHQLWLADIEDLPAPVEPSTAPFRNRDAYAQTGIYRNLPVDDGQSAADNWWARWWRALRR